MEFNVPTTKAEMYTILNDIFYYYRTKRGSFQELELQPLELTRMEYVAATDDELRSRAEVLVSAEQEREILERKEMINTRVNEIGLHIQEIEEDLDEEVQAIKDLYEESREKVERQAEKNGLISSGIVVNKLAELENQKNLRISEITLQKNNQKASLESERITIANQMSSCATYYASVHQAQVSAKFEELKAERDKLTREVFEYNNALDEKEQKYANTILQSNANMEIKYLEISQGEYSKDQLIEMGYYEDVINCVCSYFNTINSASAYAELGRDTKVVVYLEEYYPQILEMYRIRAGL